jgi:hypothetical protein
MFSGDWKRYTCTEGDSRLLLGHLLAALWEAGQDYIACQQERLQEHNPGSSPEYRAPKKMARAPEESRHGPRKQAAASVVWLGTLGWGGGG